MVDEWRLLEVEYDDPHMNLALEEAVPILVGKDVAPETLRIWRNANAVVIGRFQCVGLEVNLPKCQRYGASIVRRFTGGGAVYHDLGNLNYAISLRKENRLLCRDILDNYRALSKGVIEGLRLLGLRAEYQGKNLISINDRKVSGLAGSVTDGVFFQHGTLLASTDLRILGEVLYSPNRDGDNKRSIQSVRSPVTTLRDELCKSVRFTDVKKSLVDGFQKAFSIRLVPGRLLPEEERLARELYHLKYSQKKWNFES